MLYIYAFGLFTGSFLPVYCSFEDVEQYGESKRQKSGKLCLKLNFLVKLFKFQNFFSLMTKSDLNDIYCTLIATNLFIEQLLSRFGSLENFYITYSTLVLILLFE